MASKRQVAIIKGVAFAVGGAVVIWIGAAAIILTIYGRHHVPAAAPWLALAKFASLAWAAVVGWKLVWRRFDEMEREHRKLFWFIGSTSAILLTSPIMMLWLINGGAFLAGLLRHPGTPGTYFAMGWVGLVGTQILCSMVARFAWRLKWWTPKR